MKVKSLWRHSRVTLFDCFSIDDNQEENLFKTSCPVAMLLHTSTDAKIKAESRLQATISQAATTKKVHR